MPSLEQIEHAKLVNSQLLAEEDNYIEEEEYFSKQDHDIQPEKTWGDNNFSEELTALGLNTHTTDSL